MRLLAVFCSCTYLLDEGADYKTIQEEKVVPSINYKQPKAVIQLVMLYK